MLKSKVAVALLIGLAFASTSQAASVSYYLDQSNQLADGVNYLRVTISDERLPGVIDFTVEALQPLLDLAGNHFGIQKFAFNILDGVGAEASDVNALPEHWWVRNGGRMDGFGRYDITLQGTGNSRQDPLTFSITGVDLDTIQSYVDLSTGLSPQGFSLFAVHVAGFNFGNCGGGGGDHHEGSSSRSGGYGGLQVQTRHVQGLSGSDGSDDGSHGGGCITSAFFGGTNAVPAPPALWLLGTAVAGLVVRRLRSAKAA